MGKARAERMMDLVDGWWRTGQVPVHRLQRPQLILRLRTARQHIRADGSTA